MRSEKGITFIALILIVVLLIVLAGITIALVVTNENAETQPQSTIDFEPVVTEPINLDSENVVEEVIEESEEEPEEDVTEDAENTIIDATILQ